MTGADASRSYDLEDHHHHHHHSSSSSEATSTQAAASAAFYEITGSGVGGGTEPTLSSMNTSAGGAGGAGGWNWNGGSLSRKLGSHQRRHQGFFLLFVTAMAVGGLLVMYISATTSPEGAMAIISPMSSFVKEQKEDDLDMMSSDGVRRVSSSSDGGTITTTVVDAAADGSTTPTTEDSKMYSYTQLLMGGSLPFPLHAAQLLVCRQSVINFVINATDGRDECDGLIRAFDRTCSDHDEDEAFAEELAAFEDEQNTSPESAKQRHHQHHHHSSSAAAETSGQHHRRTTATKTRRLEKITFAEKTRRIYLWKVWMYEAYNWMRQTAHQILEGPNVFFFADEAIDDDVWQDASYVVQQNLDQDILPGVRKYMKKRSHQLALQDEELKKRLQEQQRQQKEQNKNVTSSAARMDEGQHSKGRRLQQQSWANPSTTTTTAAAATTTTTTTTTTTAATGNTTAVSQTAVVAKNGTSVKPPNLALPTSNAHVSSGVLSETYMLHQGEKVIEKVNNQTAMAAQDAKASAKAMSDTTQAVAALLNDPTSVEARTCCTSILNVYHENCSIDDEGDISDTRLFLVVLVMALCGMVKSLIRHFKVLWLPEAAGCIIVGVLSGYGLMFLPHSDLSFDGNWFLRIMVPPIIFEAALSIDKRAFNRHIVPIIIYAVGGTLFATVLTALIVHYGSYLIQGIPTIPYVESLTFGALISSIDPIAVLSVLSNMGMTDTDTIYVLIFGESLLNDGVAIVLFQTLVHFLDERLVIDAEALAAAAFHFFVVAFGSLLVGVASGMMSTVYFWLFHGCQTPLVEVLMFFCWALLPYYICDGIGWSGIVSAVATGFVMDLHIIGQREKDMHLLMDESSSRSERGANASHTPSKGGEGGSDAIDRGRRRIFSPDGHLSEEARSHINFVMEIVSTMMETAIFAYLGLFLFSHRYHWNIGHCIIAILACCLSRAVMISTLSFLANWITRFQQQKQACRTLKRGAHGNSSNPAMVIVDKKMQLALWFAGLRGAMSFALVEHIPLYDSTSGEGTRWKPELKAMTSASIIFTVFLLGGATYYIMQHMGIAPAGKSSRKGSGGAHSFEMESLLGSGTKQVHPPSASTSGSSSGSSNNGSSNNNNTNNSNRVRSNGVATGGQEDHQEEVMSAESHMTKKAFRRQRASNNT